MKQNDENDENGKDNTTHIDVVDTFNQLFFQCVRTKNTTILKHLETQLNQLIQVCKTKNDRHIEFLNNEEILEYTFKMIGNTRDILNGKGEYSLTYMMIYVWYQHFPKLAMNAIHSLVYFENESIIQPYGSWKDLKYLCYYVIERTGEYNHPIVEYCCTLYALQILKDIRTLYSIWKHKDSKSPINSLKKTITLASKWCPREKSKFYLIFNIIAEKFNPIYLHSARKTENIDTIIKAQNKTNKELRQALSELNTYLDTPQIKMCSKRWSSIDFNNVSSYTMYKNRKAFLNIHSKDIFTDSDRIECSNTLKQHIDEIVHATNDSNRTTTSNRIHGKILNVYEIMKQIDTLVDIYVEDNLDVYTNNTNTITNKEKLHLIQLQSNELYREHKYEIDILQLQWNAIVSKMRPIQNKYMIPIVDTSHSMENDESRPLFSSLGLGILMSELNKSIFKDHIMLCSNHPEWVNLSNAKNIVEKYMILKYLMRINNSDLYKALELILDMIVLNELEPNEVKQLTLIVFSDMHMNKSSNISTNTNTSLSTLFQTITTMCINAGLQSKYKTPFECPQLLFWNLRSTNEYDCSSVSNKSNTVLLSGYNPIYMNTFTQSYSKTMYEYTPFIFIKKILDNHRYAQLSTMFRKYIKEYTAS